jgi:hypothetical protein
VNYFEIYQESFNDLLSARQEGRNMKLRESKSGQIVVLNATNVSVSSPEEIFDALTVG